MFKLKDLYIAACLLGLTIYAAPAWASICFAPSGGCVDALGSDVGDDRDSQGALNECIGFTLYAPEEGDGWHCSSCVQTTGKTLYKCTKNECASEYNIKKDGEEPPHPLPGWECEACMRGYEKFWKCPKHYCSPKYGEKKHSASAAKFTCEGSNPDTCPHGDDTLYNCECTADHVEREINGVASCVRLCTEEHREYNPQTDKCECEQYYHERNGKCVHDDYNGDCQAVIDNLYAVTYSPISGSECDSLKIRLGIKKCLSGNDYWAGAAKKCGGVDYLPTVDELTKLAQCMYGQSSFALSIYGKRNDSYLEELKLSTDDHVFVWTDNQSKKNEKSMVRMFAKDGSLQYWAERDGSKYYTGNGANPTTWENNSILSQTLCRKDNESGGSCDGCDYCIASTCKSSGENRIISDSSTYEKCSDSCGGKYKCKSGYTAKYAGSNQYNCVSNSDPCEGYVFDKEYCDGYGKPCCTKCTNSSSANYGKYSCNCKAQTTCDTNTCGSEYNLDYIPLQGNCSKCSTGNKAKCEGGAVPTVFGISGRSVCYNSSHPCEMMNYASCEYGQTAPSKYIDLNESCPSGAPIKAGPITPFKSSEFIGTPFYNMQCYHCEKNSSGNSCTSSTYTATISCRLVNSVESHPSCPGQKGVGLFACDFNVPSCAFSQVGVYDNSGNALYSYGAGTGSTTVPSCRLNGTCKFFVSGGTLKGTASLTSNGNGTWSCSYTKGAGQN